MHRRHRNVKGILRGFCRNQAAREQARGEFIHFLRHIEARNSCQRGKP